MANPNMKFKDMCQSFWETDATVIEEEVKDNKDRLTATCSLTEGSKPSLHKSRHA
jgi:hypothetical protein